MFQVTFGYCLVNSSLSLNGRSNPVSKYALSLTGSVPHVGAPGGRLYPPDAAGAAADGDASWADVAAVEPRTANTDSANAEARAVLRCARARLWVAARSIT